MLPYGRQSISEQDIEAVVATLRGDWLTTGPTVAAFEEAIGALAGGHRAVSCTSGTAALHMAYAAAGVGAGDEVVTTPMTFVATASGASLLGAKVLFADVEEETGLIDPAAVSALVTDRTKVVAAVDYTGHPADYAALQPIAERVGALTLADAAHSIGGSAQGSDGQWRPVGDLADLTTFSFFPTKNMTTTEGGAVVAKDPEIARRANDFHFIGMERRPEAFRTPDQGAWWYEVQEFGLNYRLTDVACALGLSQLQRLEAFKQRRAQIWARYNEALAGVDGVRIPVQREGVDPVWHFYCARILDGRRREVFEKMRERGIGVQVNYIPVYWHPAYADQDGGTRYRRGMCPNAEAFYAEELSLPLFPDLRDDQVDQVIETLVDILH